MRIFGAKPQNSSKQTKKKNMSGLSSIKNAFEEQRKLSTE